MKKKILAMCLIVCLLATAVVGGTLAYFTDSDEATNTFIFLRNNRSLTVTLVATDGSNVRTTIVIKSRTIKEQ